MWLLHHTANITGFLTIEQSGILTSISVYIETKISTSVLFAYISVAPSVDGAKHALNLLNN